MNLPKILSAFFLLSLCFASCKDEPCANVICQNDGVCLDGTCNCPPGYTGTNCEIKKPALGDTYEGGVIFYVDSTGEHGLIGATVDQGTLIRWGCPGIAIPEAANAGIGAGQSNSNAIIAGCSDANSAARLCAALKLNGKDDWFLPSKEELYLLIQSKNAVGGFIGDYFYWSSTQSDALSAEVLECNLGTRFVRGKENTYRVRAIRKF